jgi:hypothetical protein
MLPVKVTAPISRSSCIAIASPTWRLSPATSARRSAAAPTSSDAAPPAAMRIETICGIAVIFTVRAIQIPIAEPTRIPAAMAP